MSTARISHLWIRPPLKRVQVLIDKTGYPGLKILPFSSPFEAGIQIPIHQHLKKLEARLSFFQFEHPRKTCTAKPTQGTVPVARRWETQWSRGLWDGSTRTPSPVLTWCVILVTSLEGEKTRAVVKGAVHRRCLVARCCQGASQEFHLLPMHLRQSAADQVQHYKPAPVPALKVT